MDLSTNYLGLELPHPFIAGAGPLSDTVESARRVEDAGAAAIVLRSLFEEQLHREQLSTHHSTEAHAHSSAEAPSYLPDPDDFVMGPDEYLENLRRIRDALDIPVFASLNGHTAGGWLDSAVSIEQAGAAALELNLYHVATDPLESSAELEERAVTMVREIKGRIAIPVAVKLSPFYTSLPHFARALEDAGADGLVLFNRFFEPDFDIEELDVLLELQLSSPRELLLRLRWLAILSGSIQSTSLAVTGGVHGSVEAIKAVMAGASAVQMVSAILKRGASWLTTVREEMAAWMEEKEYESLESMRGSMNLLRCPDPGQLTRANYMRILQTWDMG